MTGTPKTPKNPKLWQKTAKNPRENPVHRQNLTHFPGGPPGNREKPEKSVIFADFQRIVNFLPPASKNRGFLAKNWSFLPKNTPKMYPKIPIWGMVSLRSPNFFRANSPVYKEKWPENTSF